MNQDLKEAIERLDMMNDTIYSVIEDIIYILKENIGAVYLWEDHRFNKKISIRTLGYEYDISMGDVILTFKMTKISDADENGVKTAEIKQWFTSKRADVEPILILIEDQTHIPIWPEWWDSIEKSKANPINWS